MAIDIIRITGFTIIKLAFVSHVDTAKTRGDELILLRIKLENAKFDRKNERDGIYLTS